MRREQRILQLQSAVRDGSYQPDLDRLAAAMARDLAQAPLPEGFSAAILLATRAERALASLALAERCIPSTCVDLSDPLDELVMLGPSIVVADAIGARVSPAALRSPGSKCQLILLGGPAREGDVPLPRPLRLADLRVALEACAPARFPERPLERVLVIERDEALLAELALEGYETTCIDDPRFVFAQRHPEPFDIAFIGPSLARHGSAQAALVKLYGIDAKLCPV